MKHDSLAARDIAKWDLCSGQGKTQAWASPLNHYLQNGLPNGLQSKLFILIGFHIQKLNPRVSNHNKGKQCNLIDLLFEIN